METVWIIVGILYLVSIVLAYQVIKGWGKSKFETIWYSIFWPVLIPLYMIHVWHNRKKEE
ncbi:hypothetical protein SAMN04487851_11435 [Prevotella sp. tc2-28]|uniref:hypothetical protein n=1 Tax=Prevotella sp. tc2-28 TaxID=1761888 RepID=UPI000894550D|nr:hypothetical protein [Prevotella sp. tc2-28]SEA79068.1 hypothetical protein SAMN04487851_11435 [Prevotella sp. tc2-28]